MAAEAGPARRAIRLWHLMGKYVVHQLDANHKAIRDGLEARGVSVYPGGPLDFITGFRQENKLIEVKTAKGKLGQKQTRFFLLWKGQKAVVRTLEEACQVVGVTF